VADFPFGTVIDGRYKIVSRLGSGGMADVYLAEDEQLGRKVALKLLHRRFAADPGFVERFRREAQAAAGLQHPNVVSVYDRGNFEDTYYIAMEYLPGRSLKQLIRDEAPVAPVRAIDLTIQILQAARFAHRHGVIHRDLKPHNVIVDDADHVKVTDFGIARAGASDMTETGSIMGTAQYLSPEQAQGHAVSAGSDLYSVAVVLYEMLTGRVPFDADSAVTIALKHVSEAPTAPTRVNASVPPELEQVVMWALNKNPADRPQDADQFIDALERAKAVIEAGSGGGRTTAMTALAGVGAYKAAAATALPATARRADLLAVEGNGGPPILEEPPRDFERGSQWPWIALVILALLIGGGVAAYLLLRPQKVVVPSVVQLNVQNASTILQNDNLNVTTIDVPSPTPQNIVIHQSIQPGRKVDSGSTVTLTVSSGPGNVSVPPVSNLPLKQAEARLKAAGLKVSNVVSQPSDTIPSGQVAYTDPPTGQSVAAGSQVEIFVSSGKAKVSVPDVTGDTEADAKNTLTQDNLRVTTTTAVSSTVAAGSVISQTPAGGNSVAPGSTVALVIATAPTTAQVPDVVGQNAVQAAATLASAGFNVQQTSQTVQKPGKNNQVLAEHPGANTTQKKGSTVTIVVGSYQPTSSTGTSSSTTPTTSTTTTTTTGGSG
jgi:beta-lactam-binding protein with PASTA domain/predicted Ser/Thr protein kinase